MLVRAEYYRFFDDRAIMKPRSAVTRVQGFSAGSFHIEEVEGADWFVRLNNWGYPNPGPVTLDYGDSSSLVGKYVEDVKLRTEEFYRNDGLRTYLLYVTFYIAEGEQQDFCYRHALSEPVDIAHLPCLHIRDHRFYRKTLGDI